MRSLPNNIALVALFLIAPVVPFFYAIVNFGRKDSRLILLLFAFLFGYTFIPYENSDSERYFEYFSRVLAFGFSDYVREVSGAYTGASMFSDVYLVSLMYVTTWISSSYKVFLGIQAVIYFSFFIAALRLILMHVSDSSRSKYILFFLGCVFIYSFSAGINNIRFQTAFMVFVYFALRYVFYKEKRSIFYSGLSCLVHLGLAQVWFGLLFFFFLEVVKNKYLRTLLIASFIGMLLNLNLEEISGALNIDIVNEKVEGYTGEGYVESRELHRENWNWYVRFNQYSDYYFLTFAVLLTRLLLPQTRLCYRLFILCVILFSISFFNEMFLDSLSNRYRKIFEFFGLVYLVIAFAASGRSKFTIVTQHLYSVVLVIGALITFRSVSYNIDVVRLLLSPLVAVFDFDPTNIYDLI